MPDKIVLRSVESLIPYARNARTHSPEQVAQIAGSIREFGFTNPVLLDGENGIIAGHGRVLAARKLGITEVPCIELAHLSPVQAPRLHRVFQRIKAIISAPAIPGRLAWGTRKR